MLATFRTHFNVAAILPANLFGSVQVGTAAEIMPLIPGGKIQVADVSVVDRTIDAASDTFGVQLQLENSDYAIPGGIRCTIDFKTGVSLTTSQTRPPATGSGATILR